MSLTSTILNILFKKGDTIRDKGLRSPSTIVRFDHLDYIGDCLEEHLLDIYYPRGTKHPLPVIVSVHGGGWVYGNKEAYQYYCMNLAENGFAVVNFNYRLAPTYKFPAALEDLNSVFHWVIKYRDDYHMDPNHLFVVGDSAGAQIASQYAAILTSDEYARLFDMNIPDIKIKAMGLHCGMFDPIGQLKEKRNMVLNPFLKNLLKDYLGKDIFRFEKEMDIHSNITSSFPPAYISCSANDRLAGCNPLILQKLKDAGISYVYKEFGQDNKSNNHVFHLDIRNLEAIQHNDELIKFFRRRIEQ